MRQGEAERRKPAKRKSGAGVLSQPPGELSVTVSIGVAEPSTRNRQPEQVIQAADQALYSAKERGRNRVEMASTARLRIEKPRRAKVSRS
jgi:diguanylate cyclase (GGDEF)-like protein